MAAEQTLVNTGNTPIKPTSEVDWLHHALLHIGNCAGDESTAKDFPHRWPLFPDGIPVEVQRRYRKYISDLNTAWPEYWKWFARTEGNKILDLISKLSKITKTSDDGTVQGEPSVSLAPSHKPYLEMIRNIKTVLKHTSKDRPHTLIDIKVLPTQLQGDEERVKHLKIMNTDISQEALRMRTEWLQKVMAYLRGVIVKRSTTIPFEGYKSSDTEGKTVEYAKYLTDNIIENWGFCWKSFQEDNSLEKEKICLFEQFYQHFANNSNRNIFTLGLKKTKVSREISDYAEELMKLIQASLPDVADIESGDFTPALHVDNQSQQDQTQDWNPIFQFFNPPNVVQVFCKKQLDGSEGNVQDIGEKDMTDLREKHGKERNVVYAWGPETTTKASITKPPGDHTHSDHEVQKRIFSAPPTGKQTRQKKKDERYFDDLKNQKSEDNRAESDNNEERVKHLKIMNTDISQEALRMRTEWLQKVMAYLRGVIVKRSTTIPFEGYKSSDTEGKTVEYNELRITKQFYQELCEQVFHVFKTERLDDQTFLEAVPDVSEASRMKMADTSMQMRKYFHAYHKRLTDLRNSIGQLKEEAKTTKVEKDTLLKRLSEMTGYKLKAGNPAITDLSDPNRPQKIAEKFSEVYDNEWTNAFEEICGMTRKSEREIIQILFNAVTNCQMFCMTASKDMWDSHCKVYLGEKVNKIDKYAEQNEWSGIDKKNFLDSYRSGMALAFNNVKKDFMGQIVMGQIEMKNTNAYRIYVTSCLRLCWLMALQDPPMYVDTEFRRGNFDENRYKFYTASGRQMDFIVWPVLHTHRGGPIISKGVAQPRR